ncbi:LOW QUALITY PROTEIN: hypothetical protein M8C21_022432 [Ambrosia artemisiifolia]|uniref:Uncharacterized protein n=1 Tax=Ambrosia artemisiifolia TaxID=4212 RepID=A0AAD5D4F3_AMBAR|nr:LOW QUALITY PROTEIN: hypothetical protein M8C21_022432 [Ambrosia artemisiifolia]
MSASSGNSIPAPEAIQVLVSSLADDSPMVKQASITSLKSLAPLNPLLVLDCCLTVSRGGRRRFGNIAGVFQVMSIAIGALEEGEVDAVYMEKLAKLATAEIISSKEIKADWQRAASSLLVAIGSHLPDLMMEELFLHLSAQNSALPAMVQILADFATSDALQFTPRLKGVLSRVLPILGNVRDQHRPIFANAFKCWCQACWQYSVEFPLSSILDSDVTSFLNSAFELLLQNWATSRDPKIRTSAVEALGQLVGLVTRTLLKAALPKFVPTILELYKRDHNTAFLATCSLHNLLNASLLSEKASPLLDFEDLTVVLSTLLPVVCSYTDIKECTYFSVGLKTYNEVQHCFLTVGLVYPEELFSFLVNKSKLKEDQMTFGALCVLKHLLPRLSEVWHNKRPALIEAITLLLEEQNLGVCKALAELIVVMASHCYLVGPSGELFVEYLVRHCAMSDQEIDELMISKDSFRPTNLYYSFQQKRAEAKIGSVRPTELRAICEKGLLLITITIPEMEHVLWPFMLKMIIPRLYTGAVATVCRCISDMCRHRSIHNDRMMRECRTRVDIPRPEELFARLVVLLHNPLAREQLATQILTVLYYLASLFPKNINLFWQDEIPKMKAYVSDTEDLTQDLSYQETWDDMIINFLAETLDVVQDTDWVISLGNAFAKQYELYTTDDEHSALLHRCLGILLQKVDNRTYVRDKIDWMYKQANITIPENRLGLAVINAAESGISFPLKKRDQLLDYILTLMRRHDEEGFSDLSVELLRTQALALSACTTLVSVDPKLTNEMRNIVMKATLGFFALPNEPADAVNPLIHNLITLLCAILLTSGEDGRSRAEQLFHILKQIDQYVSSPLDYQRKRGCLAVYEMLLKFRTLCVTGYCTLGCQGSCPHIKQVDRTSRFNVANLPSAFLLPSRDALHLGDRVIAYLPRCADTNSEVRKLSAQILDQFFDISLSLPKPVASNFSTPIESSYAALSSLEDVIAILRRDTSIDPSEVFNRVISSVCILLTKDELVATLCGCSVAICDKIKPSAEGGIQAVIEFVTRRGNDLNETDISRTSQSLLSAAVHVTEKYLRHETFVAISSLAENTSPGVVFNEVLTAAARDIVTKDILRMPGGWPMQDAFYVFSQHNELSSLFLEHLISTLSHTHVHKSDIGKGDPAGDSVGGRAENEILQAAIVALTAFFRGGGKIGKRAVEQNYASVTAILTLHLGSCHSQSISGQHEQLRTLLIAYQAFCECVGDLEMGKILAKDGEHNVDEKWINLIGDLAGSISIKRPKEVAASHLDTVLDKLKEILDNVSAISVILSKYLNQPVRFQREAAAAALSEFVRHINDGSGPVLEEIVEALCRHVSDDSPMVRRLCLRGLVQIPPMHINTYTKEILGVILALLDDSDDSVQLTAVLCLLSILELAPNGVEHVLLNLCVRLRNLQLSMDPKMRANAFAAFGALSHYGSGAPDSFLEQQSSISITLNKHGHTNRPSFCHVPSNGPRSFVTHDIARILAQRGATVTIITTPQDANRVRPVISRAIQAELKIQLLELQLQLAEVGLPEGCESFDKLPSFEYWKQLLAATDLLEQPAEDLLRVLCPPPDCIISDFLFPWTTYVARRLNIPRLVFNGPGCFYLLCMHVAISSNILGTTESGTERVVLPGLPHRVEVTQIQILGSSKAISKDGVGSWIRAVEAEKEAYGIVVHTFEELEPEYVKEYKKVKDKKIWCIGPVSLCNKDGHDLVERGNKAAINEQSCLKWLDERKPGSVLYVCLGSLARISTAQAIELGLGLESLNRPFIWCIRNKTQELETWFLEQRFEERIKGRGLIVHGWAPQVLILSHQAIAGFLTHCGWNSTLEAICAGVPVVTWPFFADQFLNEVFIVEILKIGVRIGVESALLYGEEDKVGVLVKKEDVKRVVECLMEEDEDGEQRKRRVSELATMAKIAMDEGGSSYENVSSLFRDVTETNTIKQVAPLMEIEELIPLLNTNRFISDHRSDYQDFLRDLARQFIQHLVSRLDTYLASIIQAFDAPWPAIQANAIYLSSSMLALTDDQHISASYYHQVFGLLVTKGSRSTDAIVRATCSSALGMLLKSTNLVSWRADRLYHSDSGRSNSFWNLHFVMFPLMAQGHLLPMVDIARILAQRGATVTIITTPQEANRVRPVISRAIQAKLKIQLLELQLQLAEVGLPEGCESFDKLPSFEYWKQLLAATDLLEQPAEDLLRALCPPPDCIISDFLFPWTTDVARRLNIPRLVFNGPGCFYLLCMHVAISSNILGTTESGTERVVLPGLPHPVEVTQIQILGSSKAISKDGLGSWARAAEAEKEAYGIVVHTFEELEPEYVKEYKKVKDKKIWCIGPVSLCNKDGHDLVERGNKAAINEQSCLKWLDERKPGSVLYVCLGSLARISTAQAIELGLGLESLNRPFIWCIRNKTQELETWFLEQRFEERIKGRGLIVHGWAPQVLILSHQAIGGFLTHCGWNSTLEAICAGVPVVTWPFFADRFLNEVFIVEILKIGVRIGVESAVLYGEEDKVGVLVKKEDVKRAVECLMEEDEDGEQRKRRVSELATMAKIAMDEGGSSYGNVSSLFRDVTETLLTNMATPQTDLHFVIFPLMAQGHLLPMVDIARILAQRGATVTIIATPQDANRVRPVITRAIEAELKIQLLELQLQLSEVGLPEGCESFDKLPSFEYWRKLSASVDLLEQPAEDLLRSLCPPPDCIISDFLFPWTTDVARRLNIPRLVFNGPGCFYLLCLHVAISSKILEDIKLDTERVVLPGLPDRVEVTKLQLTGSSKGISEDDMGAWVRATEAEKEAYGFVVHTFEELEPEYVKEYTKVKDKKIWCIGPVSLCNKEGQDLAERGNKAAINEHDCLKWLDERQPGSVLYVCLGSLARISTAQAIELGLALDSLNRPFIWCVRNKTKELETWFLEQKFEERVRDRGLIVHGWAPQVLILSHQAIGGFLTHCGWNSTLEAICAGVPLVTWPFFADQFLNEVFIVEVLKIGVRIGVEVPVIFGDEDKVGVLVNKEEVKRVVECLMEEDIEGEQRRRRVRELATMAKIAMTEGGSSYENVSSLIRDVTETVRIQCHKPLIDQ